MVLILIIWFLFIAAMVVWNWWIIVKKRQFVNHVGQTIIRMVIGLVFWLFCRWSMELDQWLAMPLMMAFTFWFWFDLGLNLMRGEKWWYIGKTSWLDRLQKWPLPWWFAKFFLMVTGITLYFYGWSAVGTYG